MRIGSNLERVLASDAFAVTAELGPPKNADGGIIDRKVDILKGYVDAANITDCQTAVVRMSSVAVGVMMLRKGLEPIVQMTCRDRNRIAIQSDLLGAAALGVKNLLCLTGDHQKFGNHPTSKNVFDLDSMQLLQMVRAMRDDKVFANGEEMAVEPRFFCGAAANPYADPFEYRPHRLAMKVTAGADFIQTQLVYNVEKLRKFMKRAGDLGLLDKVYILAGVGPIKSIGMARYMQNNVPGLDVPEAIITRLKGVPKEKRREEGIRQCADIVSEVREIPGIAGVHIMAIEWEEAVPQVAELAGLLPRPQV